MAAISEVKFNSIEEYHSAQPTKVKSLLTKLRKTIKQAAPEAEEVISYNMPAFKFHGALVYYAAHTNHIGFYPGSSAITDIFRNELKDYKTSKGAVQFPLGQDIPLELVRRIVEYRLKENLAKAESRKLKK